MRNYYRHGSVVRAMPSLFIMTMVFAGLAGCGGGTVSPFDLSIAASVTEGGGTAGS